MLDGRQPETTQQSAFATKRGVTTSAWQSTCARPLPRSCTPASRSSRTCSDATWPSTTRMAARRELRSCALVRQRRRRIGETPPSTSTDGTTGPCGPPRGRCAGRQPPGRAPPSRGNTGNGARRGPSVRARQGTSGSSSTSPVVTSSRRARAPAVVEGDGEATSVSALRADDSPLHISPAVAADLGSPELQQLERLMPSRDRKPCTPCAGALRRLAGVDHQYGATRARQDDSAPLSPAAPTADDHHIVRAVGGSLDRSARHHRPPVRIGKRCCRSGKHL